MNEYVTFTKKELSVIVLQPLTLLNGRIRGKIGPIKRTLYLHA